MPDTQAPTGNSGIDITRLTKDSITIKWVKATDNRTSANKIRYEVMLKKHSEPNTKWRVVRDAKGIDSHVFTGLLPCTDYRFYVNAIDQAGNVLRYPDQGYAQKKTPPSSNRRNRRSGLQRRL